MGFNAFLLKLLPKPLVRHFASPYIAGETMEEAIQTVDRFHQENGLYSTVDVLGENLKEPDEAREVFGQYMQLIEAIGDRQHGNASMKLTAMGQFLDEDLCKEQILKIAEATKARGQFFRIDMEDAPTIDSTLAYYRMLREAGYDNTGIVLQSRLFRTPGDIEALKELKPNVRACIGIYREPADIAVTNKKAMKELLLEQTLTMLENGQYIGFATHDEAIIRRALKAFQERGYTSANVEFQMLMGVPRRKVQKEIQEAGYKVRLYVPFGAHWMPYSMRRLEHNPGMAFQVAGNYMRRIVGRK